MSSCRGSKSRTKSVSAASEKRRRRKSKNSNAIVKLLRRKKERRRSSERENWSSNEKFKSVKIEREEGRKAKKG